MREPTIQRQGAERIIIQLPGVSDSSIIDPDTVAKLTFRMVDTDTPISQALAGDITGRFGAPRTGANPGRDRCRHPAAVLLVVRKRVMVGGEHLTDAQPSFEQGRPVVSFRFDSAGGRRFCDATTENVNRLMAIVLDDKVISAPRINSPICQGAGIITGNFSPEQTNDLAMLVACRRPAGAVADPRRTYGRPEPGC